ncbi:MAG: hypothetical protein WB561_18500 [Terracidiphilus sp.]
MLNQLFEDFSKASESSLQMQQEMLKMWTQQWLSSSHSTGVSAEWARTFEKRWIELAIEMLNRHKEGLESTYSSGIQTIEQTFRLSEAKSSDEYRRMVEGLWQQLLKTSMDQSEAQLREFRKFTEKSFETAQKAAA